MCEAGRFSQRAALCSPCPAGTFAPQGSTLCEPCQPRMADIDLNASTPCDNCSRWTFSLVPGSTTCKTCTPGTELSTDAALYGCVPCHNGWVSPIGRTCNACPQGRVMFELSPQISSMDVQLRIVPAPSTTCVPCPASMVPAEDQLRCVTCGSGMRASDDGTRCVCATGFYNVSLGNIVQCVGPSSPLQHKRVLEYLSRYGIR